jgi:hypothetical protein
MSNTLDMAREAGLEEMWEFTQGFTKRLKAFEALVRADERSVEREACAKVCDSWSLRDSLAAEMAEEIRARGEAT